MKLTCLLLLAGLVVYAQHPGTPSQFQGVTGNGPYMVTSAGPQTPGNCVQIDANGNHVPSGSPCPSGSSLPSGTDAQLLAFPAGSAAAVTPMFLGSPISVYLPSAQLVSVSAFGQAAQSVGSYQDIWECPTQSPQVRCAVIEVFLDFPTANQNCTIAMGDVNDAYWILSSQVSTAHDGAFGVFPGFILEQGEWLSTNCASASYNVQAQVVEFNATAHLRTAIFEGFASGANVVYTAPSGKHTFFEYGLGFGPSTATASANGFPFGQMNIGNQTGGSITYVPYAVPSGQSVSSQYALAITSGTAVAANFVQPFKAGIVMNPGDFISVNSTSATAGQFWYATVIEQ